MQLKRQDGFTLVELTIAMAIFAFLLLIMTQGVLQLYRIYEAGHEIRDTQEAARTIAQQITDDTHDSLAVAVGTVNGQSSICLFQTKQQQQSTLNGVEYYIAAHDTGSTPLSSSLAVHRADISAAYTSTTPPACPAPGSPPTADAVLTSNTVVVHSLQATAVAPAPPAVIPQLVTLKMSVESAYAQQPGDTIPDPNNPGFNQCVGGTNAQYCSISNIQLAAFGRPGESL